LAKSKKRFVCQLVFSHRLCLLSFSLDEKETKNQGKNMLPRTTSAGLPKAFGIFADPTHVANGIVIFIISFFELVVLWNFT
jgi:hypothetical protein